MTAAYQVNIHIDAGLPFTQEYYITNPDRSPRDITGFKFLGSASKHPTSIDATQARSGNPVYKMLPFTTRVVDGQKGIMSISMPKEYTARMAEGKYVYNVTMKDINGHSSTAVSGLCFVNVATPELPGQVILDGGGAFMEDGGNVLDGGGAYI